MRPTRKQKAKELFERAAKGPSYSLTFTKLELSSEVRLALVAEMEDQYAIWAGSWILPDLRRLMPELADVPTQKKEMRI